jgi:hypothetical protein
MKKRYVPKHYYRELFNRLQIITQGTKIVEEYHKELEAMIRANVNEDEEVFFFFGKLTYVLKEEDTNIIRGIPQIYNDNRSIKQQMATG